MTSSLDSFLPPDGTNLTFGMLLDAYGRWWQAQSSLSDYPRYYDTNTQSYMILWEGSPGAYTVYGDFADDDHFYNYVVKGSMLFFKLDTNAKPTKRYKIHRWHYQTLEEMRDDMIRWTQVAPTLGEGGEALQTFIAAHAQNVIDLLTKDGKKWARTGSRYSLVYRADRDVFLCLWEGDADAVQPREVLHTTKLDHPSNPRLKWSAIKRYSEICVRFMRLPTRFEIYQREWTAEESHRSYYNNITRDITLRSFQALAERPLLTDMRFYGPADRPDE
jgi:hypothetical protein